MAQLFRDGMSFSGYERDTLFMSRGDGRFIDISGVSGLDSITDGRGLAFADLDNDGDLDVVKTPVQELARMLFRNNVGQDNAFVRVELEGTRSARDAFGAVVRLDSPLGTQTKLKSGGTGFLSSGDPRLVFGLGAETEGLYELTVSWPSGIEESFDVRAGESVHIREGGGLERVDEERFTLPDPQTPAENVLQTLTLRLGEEMPALSLRELDGDAPFRGRTSHAGRQTLLNFWATWCVPCAVEMPELEELFPRLKRAGVDLVGVSLDTELEMVSPYLQQKAITYPNAILPSEEFDKIFPGATLTVPLTLLLDETGVVIDAYSGWSPETERALEALAAGAPDANN